MSEKTIPLYFGAATFAIPFLALAAYVAYLVVPVVVREVVPVVVTAVVRALVD